MLILNHPCIRPLNLVRISSQEQITHSLPSDFLLLSCDSFTQTLALARFCNSNTLAYASFVRNTKEALFLVNLNVRFLLCREILAKTLQKLAETYLFDAKILLCIQEEQEIEKTAECGIDGVIFANL